MDGIKPTSMVIITFCESRERETDRLRWLTTEMIKKYRRKALTSHISRIRKGFICIQNVQSVIVFSFYLLIHKLTIQMAFVNILHSLISVGYVSAVEYVCLYVCVPK